MRLGNGALYRVRTFAQIHALDKRKQGTDVGLTAHTHHLHKAPHESQKVFCTECKLLRRPKHRTNKIRKGCMAGCPYPSAEQGPMRVTDVGPWIGSPGVREFVSWTARQPQLHQRPQSRRTCSFRVRLAWPCEQDDWLPRGTSTRYQWSA